MAMKHRKLFPISTDTNQTDCPDVCDPSCSYECYPYPDFYFMPLAPPPPPPPPPSISSNQGPNVSPYLIIAVGLLASFFLLISYYVIFVKCCSNWNPSRRPPPQPNAQDEEFLDQNQGPAIDHPIWYINTIGLQPSVINSIAVFKYKKGDPLIEGSVCSVCLSEFQEDEKLRLLPKCSHAFHIPCIDTWLRSHTTCPLCRAGILSNTLTTPSASNEQSPINLSVEVENNQAENLGMNVELRVNEGGSDNDECENRDETEADGSGVFSAVNCMKDTHIVIGDEIQAVRRSVSMDSSSAASISLAVANLSTDESEGNWVNCRNTGRKSGLGIFEAQDSGSSRTMGRGIDSPSIAESLQNSSVSMKRSFSCGGRLFSSSSRYNKNSSSILPL